MDSVALPAGVTVTLELRNGTRVTVKGQKSQVSRLFVDKCVSFKVEADSLVLKTDVGTKREKRAVYSAAAHVRNMVLGVQKPFVYKLKVCSSHFPMTAAVQGAEFVVKNFLGEKVPRKTKMHPDVSVKVAGAEVVVESANLEAAGQIAGAIELLTFVSRRDRRIFQDGVHLFEKPGREAA